MSYSEEDDLPDLAFKLPGNFNHSAPYVVTPIDVDAEIAEDLARKERKKQISQKPIEVEESLPEQFEFAELAKPTICEFPPNRQLFVAERSLKSFNCDSLDVQNFFASSYTTCTSENAEEFLSWINSTLKSTSDDLKRQFFQYLWLLVSCHSDPLVVQRCCDFLIEYNTSWRLKYEEVILVFFNWGAAPEDFVTNENIDKIIALLDPSPIVSVFNVEGVLKVMQCQLMVQDLEGIQSCTKSVFVLLTLLSLEKEYWPCLSYVHVCLNRLALYAESQNPHWVGEYCLSLFQLESHHARWAFLLECVLPESMRWCVCLAFCQKVFSQEQTFAADPEPILLLNILLNHIDEFLKLKPWKLYSLISIVDSGLSQIISHNTSDDIKRRFLEWLNQYMLRKGERRPDPKSAHIDIDGPRIAELVSRLQVEWESKLNDKKLVGE